MKNVTTIIVIVAAMMLATSSNSNAAIRIVSNYNPNPESFSDLGSAISASSNGDTIYIQGSPNGYNFSANINKQLTIIGAGVNPLQTNPYSSTMNQVGGPTISSSFVKIIGIVTNQVIVLSSGVHDITLDRCYFNQGGNVFLQFNGGNYNINVEECSIYGAWFSANNSTVNNLNVSNCVFYMPGTGNPFFSAFNGLSTNINISNNVFTSYSPTNIGIAGNSNAQFFNFSNNVFNNIQTANIYNSSFYNNLTNNCSNNTPWSGNGNTDLGGNISNADPEFVNEYAYNGNNYFISISNDPNYYQFSSGSPCLATNHSGYPDMGVYGGGTYSWYNITASPLPFVYSLNIPTPNIQAGQNLNIQVVAKKHN
jgi:hypothetical protein